MASILIIDDNLSLCEALSKKISKLGHNANHYQRLTDGMHAARNENYDVIFLDVGLPDGSGLSALEILREKPYEPEVIIITGQAEVSGARLAIESGAWDYVEKGASLDDMILPLERALQYRSELKKSKTTVSLKREGIIGESNSINKSLDLVAQASTADVPVCITGETGTGKELFAWAIHTNSTRSENNFVVVDCAALPENLVESVLFGHEAGAFTGANKQSHGLIKSADGGTLFLDEIGELPLSIQKSFLRVLQEHTFKRVGGSKDIHSDFRVISATNRDLNNMTKDGGFREDLLYRLNAMTIHLPPLRDRENDIELLTSQHLSQFSQQKGMERKGSTREFIASLKAYEWPGNIRELFNVLDQAVLSIGDRPTLFPFDLPPRIRFKATVNSLSEEAKSQTAPLPSSDSSLPDLKAAREEMLSKFEADYLRTLMNKTNFDINAASKLAGLSRPRLYELIRKYGISKKDD